jgi:hypothetical protein
MAARIVKGSNFAVIAADDDNWRPSNLDSKEIARLWNAALMADIVPDLHENSFHLERVPARRCVTPIGQRRGL